MAFLFGQKPTFRPVRSLGRGGSGRVDLVHDDRSNRVVAIKSLLDPTPSRLDRFRQEYVTLGSIRHDGIVAVHDFWEGCSEETPSFSMEYVDGLHIGEVVAVEGLPSTPMLLGELLGAVEFLHASGVIHRDLKPENVLVRKHSKNGNRVALVDFGMAFHASVKSSSAPAGTIPYLAPELFQGATPSVATDLYSVGAIAYELVAGRPPIDVQHGDLGAWLAKIERGVDPGTLGACEPQLRDWILRMLSTDPADRPIHATEARSLLTIGASPGASSSERTLRRAHVRSGRPPARDETLDSIWKRLEDPSGPRLIFLSGESALGKTELLRRLGVEAVHRGWLVEHGANAVRAIEQSNVTDTERDALVLLDDVVDLDPDPAALDRIVQGTGGVRIVASVRPTELATGRIANYFAAADVHPLISRQALSLFGQKQTQQFLLRCGVTDKEASRSASEWVTASGGVPGRLYAAWCSDDAPVHPTVRDVEGVDGKSSGVVSEAQVLKLDQSTRKMLFARALLPEDTLVEQVWELAGLDDPGAREAERELIRLGALNLQGSNLRLSSPAWRRAACLVSREDPENWFLRAATTLESSPECDQRWLGRLELLGGEIRRGVARLLTEADDAAKNSQLGVSAEVLLEALRYLPRNTDERGSIWLRVARVLFELERHEKSYRAFASAIRSQLDKKDLVEARYKQAFSLLSVGRVDPSKVQLRLPGPANASATIEGMFVDLYSKYRQGRRQEALDLATDLLDENPGPEIRIEILQVRGLCASALREDRIAEDSFRQGIQLGNHAGRRRLRVVPKLGLALHRIREDRVQEAIELLDSASAEITGPDADHLRLLLAGVRWQALFRLRRFDRSIREVEEMSFAAARAGNQNALINSQVWKADILLNLGQPAVAEQTLSRIFASGKTRSDARLVAFTWLSRAEANIALGEHSFDRAEECIEKARAMNVEDAWVPSSAALLDLELAVARKNWGEAKIRSRVLRDIVEAQDQGLQQELRFRQCIADLRIELVESPQRVRDSPPEYIREVLDSDVADLAAVAWAALTLGTVEAGEKSAAQNYHRQGSQALQQAADLLSDPDYRNDFLARPEFRILREPLDTGKEESERLVAVYRMIHALNSESDPEALLDTMLDMALEVVEAERGMVLLRGSDGEFRARVARNLEQETIKDAEEFSRSVVSEAVAGRAVLAMDTGHDERLKDFKSVSVFGIRSLICVPLRSGAQIIGAVYLDNRKEGALFNTDDLRFLEAFADHAALALRNAQRESHLTRENKRLRVLSESRDRFDDIVGRSQPMQEIYDLIERFAETALPVMIYGESGTGKELIAKAIHRHGPRRKKAYLTENCASITETLLEAELFGHVKGSFTGADRDRPGLFLEAHKGTLFLDEIGDMPASMQARLLRVLQEGELRRVGGNEIEKVDVRILAATHRDLAARVVGGQFREDLLFRLQVLQINVPPLRDRQGDVPLLVEHFLERIGKAKGGEAIRIFNNVMDLLERYPWPGNVRELENVLQRLCVLSGRKAIRMDLIESNEGLRRLFLDRPETPKATPTLATRERVQILDALERTGGNKAKAAKLLGVSRATFFRRLKQYEI